MSPSERNRTAVLGAGNAAPARGGGLTRVAVDLPAHVVASIVAEARALGVTPGDVVRRDLIREAAAVPRDVRIRKMVQGGMCDANIAEFFHVTTTSIALKRRGMGLPANPRYPRKPIDRKAAS